VARRPDERRHACDGDCRDGEALDLTDRLGRAISTREARFFSLATDPDATRAEIERLSPVSRGTVTYDAGLGASLALTRQRAVGARARLRWRAGVAGQAFDRTESLEIVEFLAGVDPEEASQSFRAHRQREGRGGLLFGLEWSVRLTRQFNVSPEFRVIVSRAIGDSDASYGELAVGMRGMWSF
jgi:hypothetical protein